LTAGSIFEKTRTNLTIWFAAIFLVAHDKRGVSATLIANELEISYQTAWTMMQKIRKAMADRDADYTLSGLVEIDDFYIGAPTENGKRGRGTDKNQVLIALSKNKKGHPLFVKMEVIENMKKETVEAFVTGNIALKSTLIADGHRTIPTLKDDYKIEAKKFNVKEDPEHMKWIHTIISNLKSFVQGTFHGLDSRHLQRYLDEFSFRFNRRKFTGELFNRLLQSCLSTNTITYPELVG
jgi:transposase-like protein